MSKYLKLKVIHGKKGVSPLIATVLLIAIFISLGVMFSNFAQRTAEQFKETIEYKSGALDCESVAVNIVDVYVSELKFEVSNKGTLGVDEAHYNLMFNDGSPDKGVDFIFADKLLPGEKENLSDGDISSNINKVEVIPIIITDTGDKIGCSDRKVSFEVE